MNFRNYFFLRDAMVAIDSEYQSVLNAGASGYLIITRHVSMNSMCILRFYTLPLLLK